jgi:hypothetical protein
MTQNRINKQQETIKKVIKWLEEDGYDPVEKTHMYQDSNYCAVVNVSENMIYHVMFPSNPLDKVDIFQLISMDETYRRAYKALSPLQQNKFFFILKFLSYK